MSTLEVIKDEGVYRLPEVDLLVEDRTFERYTTRADDFDSATGEVRAVRGLRREGWTIRIETRTVLTCTPEDFRIKADLDAYLDGERRFCRCWDLVVPRDCL